MNQEIASFLRSWTYIRGMTAAFIEAVPNEHWDFRPSDKHGPLSKQFRHMVWVTDLYMSALREAKMNMATKKQGYTGSTERAELLIALKERDSRLFDLLKDPKFASLEYRVDFFGTPMTFGEFTHVMIQHESLHQGMWSVFAKQAGFETPSGWRDDWNL